MEKLTIRKPTHRNTTPNLANEVFVNQGLRLRGFVERSVEIVGRGLGSLELRGVGLLACFETVTRLPCPTLMLMLL